MSPPPYRFAPRRARSSVVEHLTFNQRVPGSNPGGRTNPISHLPDLRDRRKYSCGHYVGVAPLPGASGASPQTEGVLPMSIFQADCPHCDLRSVAFTIVSEMRAANISPYLFDTLAICGRSSRGILASFNLSTTTPPPPTQLIKAGRANEIGLPTISPAAPSTGAPDRTPERAADYYRQGMENLPGNLDAASSMFRSALEAGLREKFSDIEGTLYQRIESAADQGGLAADLADWAHQIRLGGNDAVHGGEQFSREEAERLQAFTELVFL